MKKSFKTLSVLSVLFVSLSAQSALAAQGFTTANDAVYRGHNEGFHGFEYNNSKFLISKQMTNLAPASKSFPNFGAVINFALAKRMTLRANLSCAKAPCEVKVVQGAQVIQGQVNVAFKSEDLSNISTAMKAAGPNENQGQGRQQRRDGAPMPLQRR